MQNSIKLILTMLLLLPVLGLSLPSCSESDNFTQLEEDGPVERSDTRPNVIFIFTDDQGYADIGAQGIDVKNKVLTPNIDQLAATGVRMTDGYVTAPQCTPSRAALMTGRYQQKFGVDDNAYSPFPLEQITLAEKLSEAGYKTGMVGKWHLEIDPNSRHWYENVYAPNSNDEYQLANIPFSEKVKYYPENRGFEDTFFGYRETYRANYELSGKSIEFSAVKDSNFRVDVVSDAAVTFIRRHKRDPFFLYVAYFAPHVPLEATEEYLSRFPGDMPERRRFALAMMAAMDDGVGKIMDTLKANGIDDDTIVFFISDNGAPLAMTKDDVMPAEKDGPYWDGSLNAPWVGEKGMLTEGAIRVPFIVNWNGHLPSGLVYKEPVISIDASTTAASLAGVDTSDMDGVNLIPLLNGSNDKPVRSLYWRFWEQSAIRTGDWKYLRTGNEAEYLFNLSEDNPENVNLIQDNPEVAEKLKLDLAQWADTLKRPGLSDKALSSSEKNWYEFYFNN